MTIHHANCLNLIHSGLLLTVMCVHAFIIGTEPMGLFWSMKLSPGQRAGSRFNVKDVTKPVIVHLSLYRGHLDTHMLQTAEPEASTAAERWYMGKDVERIKVQSGRLRGTVFKPRGTF